MAKPLSAIQRAALTDAVARQDGRVLGGERTIEALMVRKLVRGPHYSYGRGKLWATITDAGRKAAIGHG